MKWKFNKKKIIAFLLPILVPSLGLIYASADYYGLTDKLTLRQKASDGLNLLLYGNGYPNAFIGPADPEFDALKKIIDANTRNPKILKVIKEGYEPMEITIEGTYAQWGNVPEDWEQRIVIPDESQVMYLYDSDQDGNANKTSWVGRASDIRAWIESHRNRERFLVSTVLFTILSLWVGVALRKKSNK